MILSPAQNYRDLLRSELALRYQKNPRYSLRAFARDLKLSSARMSEILAGKKGLSRAAAQKIALCLGFNPQEQELFCDLVDREHARSQTVREQAELRIKSFQAEQEKATPTSLPQIHQLAIDRFRQIEDWYPVAILQYLKLKKRTQTPAAIAREFGLSEFEVTEAIARMERLGLIEAHASGWRPVHTVTTSGGEAPSQSIRRHHEQLLEQAKKALHFRPMDERTFRSSVFSVELDRMPEIEERIRKFSLEIIAEFSTTQSRADVVALTTQFFPLSQGVKK